MQTLVLVQTVVQVLVQLMQVKRNLAEARFFRLSCSVPWALNLAFSLYRDLLELGGGALFTFHVFGGHLRR